MTGETDLALLLKGMEPVLQPGRVVFARAPEHGSIDPGLSPLGTFREKEGLTLIVDEDEAAKAGLTRSAPMRQITLAIHSSLEAVGLTAAISAELTRQGISANVVAAYFHDHVFVPEQDAEKALSALKALSRA